MKGYMTLRDGSRDLKERESLSEAMKDSTQLRVRGKLGVERVKQ